MMDRPPGFQKRDLLVGVLVGGAIKLNLHPALDIASKACAPLFDDYPPDTRLWYPVITSAHAQAAIAYAGRVRDADAITVEEYEWVCDMARKAIMRGNPLEPSLSTEFPDALGGAKARPRLLLEDGGDDGNDPQAA